MHPRPVPPSPPGKLQTPRPNPCAPRRHLPNPTHPPPRPPNLPPKPASTEACDLSWDDAAAGAPPPPAGAAAAALSEVAPFENYILGVLTNFSAVSLDRLHNLLRVFVVGEPKYEGRSQEQLGAYLAHLVAQGRVEVDNGVYRRSKG